MLRAAATIMGVRAWIPSSRLRSNLGHTDAATDASTESRLPMRTPDMWYNTLSSGLRKMGLPPISKRHALEVVVEFGAGFYSKGRAGYVLHALFDR